MGLPVPFAKAFLDHGTQVLVADLAAGKYGTAPPIKYEELDVRDDAAVEALAFLRKRDFPAAIEPG